MVVVVQEDGVGVGTGVDKVGGHSQNACDQSPWSSVRAAMNVEP